MGLFDIVSYMDDLLLRSGYDTAPSRSYYKNTYTEKINGILSYYENGKLSRLGGPAMIYPDGKEEYWFEGKQITKDEHDKLYEERENNKLHTIYIDGKPRHIKGSKLKLLNEILEK